MLESFLRPSKENRHGKEERISSSLDSCKSVFVIVITGLTRCNSESLDRQCVRQTTPTTTRAFRYNLNDNATEWLTGLRVKLRLCICKYKLSFSYFLRTLLLYSAFWDIVSNSSDRSPLAKFKLLNWKVLWIKLVLKVYYCQIYYHLRWFNRNFHFASTPPYTYISHEEVVSNSPKDRNQCDKYPSG